MSAVIVSKNPATLEEAGRVPETSPEEVAEKVKAAREAHPGWAGLSYRQRGEFLLKVRKVILDQLDPLARVISEDNGKPVVEALSSDILPVCDFIQYFAKNTEKLLKSEQVPLGIMGALGRRSKIHFSPLGLVGIISPWNFPFSIPMTGIVMALMAGNCVLLKPADATPLVGAKIEEIFREADLPPGVFTHLPGGAETGEALLRSPIDKVIFTGSVRVGKRVMQVCAENLIPCTLELGGKDPMIVCHDAHLENAAKAAVWGGFCNAGQVCASVERIYVDERIAEKFIHKVVEKTRKLKQGIGINPHHDIGPLTTEAQLKIVEDQVEDARSRGAAILTGGEKNKEFPGHFYKPTVLTGVNHNFKCMMEETFGPLLPIMSFKSEDEAVKLANDSVYGLTASVWTQNLKRGRALAKRIRAGTVAVNECAYTFALCQTPWGGVKHSGFGRTHGPLGLLELVHIQHLHENLMPKVQDFWWFGYGPKRYDTLKSLSKNFSGNALHKVRGALRAIWATRMEKY